MMEPLDTMSGDEGEQTTINLLELFEESDSEDDFDDPDVGETLHDFLILTIKGPQLDEQTVVLLSNNGVVDIRSFLLYSKQSYQEMLSPIGTKKLLTLSRSMQQDIRDVKIYGEYVFTHDLVDTNGDLNLDAMDPQGYQVYLRSHRRENGKALQAAVGLELNARVSEKQARLTLKSTLLQSLEVLSNTSKMNDEPPTNNDDSIRPCRVTLDTPPYHVQSAGSTSTGENIGIQDYAKTDPSTEAFLRKLDYTEDEPADLLHMVTPTKEELESLMRPEATFLTPGHGSPATDPAYKNRLQNPDTYGAIAKTKQLPMISSKFQWNGKRSTFDEVKRLVEGHFEGYGGAYLVNRKFIKVYIENRYKVLRFFP